MKKTESRLGHAVFQRQFLSRHRITKWQIRYDKNAWTASCTLLNLSGQTTQAQARCGTLEKKTSIDSIYNIEFSVEDLYENESSEHSVLLCFTPPWLAFAVFLRLHLCCRPVKIARPGQNPKSFLLLFGTSQLAKKTNMDRTTRKASANFARENRNSLPYPMQIHPPRNTVSLYTYMSIYKYIFHILSIFIILYTILNN